MPLQLITIPCLSDDYAYVVVNPETKEAALIDVPEAEPINKVIARSNWTLRSVLITHHHPDHIQGLADLQSDTDVKVFGAKADAHRLPKLDHELQDGDEISICGEKVDVLDVSGHTIGHIAFHFPTSKLAFTADSLMAMGCGRLFEGTPAQMWESLKKIRDLPPETVICSGHEYTQSNAKFAASLGEDNPVLRSRVDDINKARQHGLPTVPSPLSLEMETNPFLRADYPSLMSAVGMERSTPEDVFAEIRKRKDHF